MPRMTITIGMALSAIAAAFGVSMLSAVPLTGPQLALVTLVELIALTGVFLLAMWFTLWVRGPEVKLSQKTSENALRDAYTKSQHYIIQLEDEIKALRAQQTATAPNHIRDRGTFPAVRDTGTYNASGLPAPPPPQVQTDTQTQPIYPVADYRPGEQRTVRLARRSRELNGRISI